MHHHPEWRGEYNDILQSNTCSIDNKLAIISSNKTTIKHSLKLIGTTLAETKFHHTLPGRKYSSTTKYPCTDCAIYQMNIQLGAKIEIEIYRYQKFVLLGFTAEKFFILYILTFHSGLKQQFVKNRYLGMK